MKRIITYETYGETFVDESVAMCFEATMVLRALTLCKEEDKALHTAEQEVVILDLIMSKYNQYQVPIKPVIDDWREGELDFNDLTIGEIREYVENKTDEVA